MCCHRVISLLQSALSPSRRRRVQDDDSTNANVVHRPQQVVLITDEEERGMPMVLDHQFIDQPMHLLLLCPWHVAHANLRHLPDTLQASSVGHQ